MIAAAYRALAKKFHPDTASNESDGNVAKFRRIHEAYLVLSDPESRLRYDQLNGLHSHQHHTAASSDAPTKDVKKASVLSTLDRLGYQDEMRKLPATILLIAIIVGAILIYESTH